MGDRCYACCQENCGYRNCNCWCHEDEKPKAITLDPEPEPPAIERCPCKKHRQYRAIKPPATGCVECWRYYVKKNP